MAEARREELNPHFRAPAPASGLRIPHLRPPLPVVRARNEKRTAPAGNQFCRDRTQSGSGGADGARVVCEELLRWSDLWFAGIGVVDGPESSDPFRETTAEHAPQIPGADRQR